MNATVRTTRNDEGHPYAAPAYLAVEAEIDGEKRRFLFTAAEVIRGMERGATQPEEFEDTEDTMNLTQFFLTAGRRVGHPASVPSGPPDPPPDPGPTPAQPDFLVASWVDSVTGTGLVNDPALAEDQSDKFMRMLLEIPDERTIVFPAGWTLRIDNLTVVPPKKWWTIQGNGLVLKRTTSGRVLDANGNAVYLAPRDGDPDVYRDPISGLFLWTDSLTDLTWRVRGGEWQRANDSGGGGWIKLAPAYPKPTVPRPIHRAMSDPSYSAIENVRAAYSQRWPRRLKHLVFEAHENLTISGVRLEGVHTIPTGDQNTPGDYVEDLEGQHAFEFLGCTNVTADGIEVDAVYGDLFYAGDQVVWIHPDGRLIRTYRSDFHWYDGAFHATLPALSNPATEVIEKKLRWTENVEVTNYDLRRSGRQGIGLTAARNIHFDGGYVGKVTRTLIDNEPNSAEEGTIGFLIENSTFGPAGNTTFAGHGAKGYCNDITLRNCILDGHRLSIIYNDAPPSHGGMHEGLTVEGLVQTGVLISQPVPVIRAYYIKNLTVRDCVIPFNDKRAEPGAGYLVQYNNCCNVDIGGHTLEGGKGDIRPAQPEFGYAGPSYHSSCPTGTL